MTSVTQLYATPNVGPPSERSENADFPASASQRGDEMPSGDGAELEGLEEDAELMKDFQEEIERQLEELREELEVTAQDEYDRSCTALEERRPQFSDTQAYEAARARLDSVLESKKRQISRMLEKQRKAMIEKERAIRKLSLGGEGQSPEISAALVREQEQLLHAIQKQRRETSSGQSTSSTHPNRTPSRVSTNPQFQPSPSLWLPPSLDTEPARPSLGRTASSSSSIAAPRLAQRGSSGSQSISQSLFPHQNGSALQSSWLGDTSAKLYCEPESIVHEDESEDGSESEDESEDDGNAKEDEDGLLSRSTEHLFDRGSTVPAKSAPRNIMQTDARVRPSSDKDRDSALRSQTLWKTSLENMRAPSASQPRIIPSNQVQNHSVHSRTTSYTTGTTNGTTTATAQNRRVSTSRTTTVGSDGASTRETDRQWGTSTSASPPVWGGLSSSVAATAAVSGSAVVPIPVPPSNTLPRTSDSAGGSSSLSSSFRETHIWRPRENSKSSDGPSASPAALRHPSLLTGTASSSALPSTVSTPSPSATRNRPRTDGEPATNANEGVNGPSTGSGIVRGNSLRVAESNATPNISAAPSPSPWLYARRTASPPPLATATAANTAKTTAAPLSRLPTEIIDDGSSMLDHLLRTASTGRSGDVYDNGGNLHGRAASASAHSSSVYPSADGLLSSFDDPFDQQPQQRNNNSKKGMRGEQNRERELLHRNSRGSGVTTKPGLSNDLAMEREMRTENEQDAIYLPFAQFEPDESRNGQEPARDYSWEDEEARRRDRERDRVKTKAGEKYRELGRNREYSRDRQKESERQRERERQKEKEREKEREAERQKEKEREMAREREAMERAHRLELDELSREWEDRFNNRVDELTSALNDVRRSEDLQRRRLQQLETQQKEIEHLREEETEKLRKRINELKDQHHRQNEQLKQDLLEQARTREADIIERHRQNMENLREQHRKRESDLIQEHTRLENELVELQRNLEAEILRLQNKREEDLLEQERELENAFEERTRKRDLELAQAQIELAKEQKLREEEQQELECKLQELMDEKESEIFELKQQHAAELAKRLDEMRIEHRKRDAENRREREELQRCRKELLQQQEAAEQQRQREDDDKAETLRMMEAQRQNYEIVERQREELERRWMDLQKLEEDLAQRREELNQREEKLRRDEELFRRQREDDRPRKINVNCLQRDRDNGRDSPRVRDRYVSEDREDLEALRAQEIENKRAWEESQRRKDDPDEARGAGHDQDGQFSNLSHSPEEIKLQEDLFRYYKARQNSTTTRSTSNAGTTPPTSFSSASGSFSGPGRAASNASSAQSNWGGSQRSSVSSASSAASDFSRASASTSASSTWSSSTRGSTTASSTATSSTSSNKTAPADTPKGSNSGAWKTPNATGAGDPAPSATATGASASSGPYPTGNNAPINEAEWQRRQEEQARRQQEQFRRENLRAEQEKAARAASAAAATSSGREAVQRAWATYENAWATLKERPKLFFRSMPWPVLKPPVHPEELTTNVIGAFVLSPVHSPEKSNKDRLKEQLLRWHPDRFESKWVPKVDANDKEYVRTGAGQVARALNELMARENSTFA